MSAHDNGGPAFPVYDHHGNGQQFLADGGMTLRDYFAAKAMQSLIIEGAGYNSNPGQIAPMASTAYQWADAMLKERSK